MRVTADVTRYATGDVRRTCVIPTDPTRPDPNLLNTLWSPITTSSSSVPRGPRDGVVSATRRIEVAA